MIIIIFTLILFIVISFFSMSHMLGLWLLLMITHGIVYEAFGSIAAHLPFYAGLIVLVTILVRKQWSDVKGSTLWLFSALIAVMSMSGLLGLNVETSVVSLMCYAKGFLLALILAGSLKSKKNIQIMTLYCLVGLIMGALMVVYQYKTGTFTINTIYVQRAASLRGDPNDTAMLLVAGIPLALYWFNNAKGLLVKGVFAGSMLLLLIGLVLTFSRGGFVVFILVSTVIYLKRPTLRMTFLGVLIAFFFCILTPQNYWERIETLITGQERYRSHSLENRSLLQKRGLAIFVTRPVLGVGPGNFGNAFAGRSGYVGEGLSVAHNMYLEFFVENGLVGGVLLLIILYQAIRCLMVYDHKTRTECDTFGLGFSIALALAGMLFSCLFLSQGKNSVLWFMVGLGFALGQIAAKSKGANSKLSPGVHMEINGKQLVSSHTHISQAV